MLVKLQGDKSFEKFYLLSDMYSLFLKAELGEGVVFYKQ